MADRFQNINIVYKVNTVDVERASQSLNKAKAANDALVKSAQDLGVQGQKSASQYSQTIAGLTLQMQQLKAQIDLTKQSDTARLQQLTGQYREMQAQLDKYNASLNLTNTATKQATMGLGDMYMAVRLFLTAGLVKELVTAAISMATLAGKIQGVKLAFDKLPNSELLMQRLTTATHGMVDELTLMQKALQAKNFGIPLEKLGMLLEFATIRAQQTGISVDYLVDSIVTGLGRNSVKILDNLQINIGELHKRIAETGDTMQNVAIQMIGESLKKMDGYVITSETKVNQLSAAWENFKQVLSLSWIGKVGEALVEMFAHLVAPSGESNALTAAAQRVNDFIDANDKLLHSEKAIMTVERELDKLKTDLLIAYGRQVDATKAVAKANLLDVDAAIRQRDIATFRHIQIAKEIELLERYAKGLALIKGLEVEKGILETLREKLSGINDEREKTISEDRILALNKESAEVQRQIDVYENLGKEIENNKLTFKSFHDDILKQLEEISKKLQETLGKGLEKGATPAGGFVQPLGKSGGGNAGDGVSTAAANMKTDYDLQMSWWDKLLMGFEDMHRKIHKTTEQTVIDQRRMWERMARDVQNILVNTIGNHILAQGQLEIDNIGRKEDATRTYYENQITMAGDNVNAQNAIRKKEAKEIAALEKQKAEAERRQAEMRVIINTAAAIAKAFEDYGWPYGLIPAAFLAASAAVQISDIKSAQGYKEGVIDIKGPGTATSDSINAKLSKGESVMTAEETRNNMGILKAIRAKKIDDKFISEILAKQGGSQSSNWDDARIVAAIERIKQPDIVRQGAEIYEAKEVGKNAKRYIRSKYLNP